MIKGDVCHLFLYGNLGRRKQIMRWLVYAIKSLIPASLALAGFCLPMLDGLQTSSSYKIHAPLAQSTNIVFVMPVEGMKNPGDWFLRTPLPLRYAMQPGLGLFQAN